MAWTDNLTIDAGVTSTGLIVGNSTIAGAVASNVYVSGTANDFTISHGGILRAQAGGVTNGAHIVGTSQAQHIIEHTGVANDTVVENAAGYMWQRGSSYRAVVKKGHQSLVGANARAWSTTVEGGEQRVLSAGAVAYDTVLRGGNQIVSSGTFASGTVISGGSMRVYGGATVDGVTIMVGNGTNAVLRPEADGATFTGDICMNLTTAVTVTTTANYFISSVSRIAASSGVTFSIKVKEYDQFAGEYCVGGGTTNITATVTTDTGKTLGTISRGTGNPAYTHTQYGAYRLYNNTYLYLSVVTGAAVYNSTTSVAQQGKVLEDAVVGNGQSAYVYADGSALRMTMNGNGVVRVYGEITSATVNDTGAAIVYSGGVAKNTLVNANSQYVYAGGSALDTVVHGGNLTLAQAEAYARNITIYGGDGRLILNTNGTMVDGDVNVDVSEISGDNTSGNTFINSLSRVLNYTPHGVTFTVTVAEDGQRAGNYFYAGNLNNFTATVVTDTGKTLGTINGVTGNGNSGAWLHTQYGSYRFYNDTYVMLGIVDGHKVEQWAGDTLTAYGDTLDNVTVDTADDIFVYDGGVASGTTLNATSANLHISSGGVASDTTIQAQSAWVRVYDGGLASGGTITTGRVQVCSGGLLRGISIETAEGGVARVDVSSGGVASGVELNVNGIYMVSGGGRAVNTIVRSGYIHVSGGASAYDTVVSGGEQKVFAGASAVRAVAEGAGIVRVSGYTISTTLRGTAQELLYNANAVASNTVISGGAQKVLSSGAVASDTVIYAGYQQVVAGASAWNTTIVAGGNGYASLAEGAVTGGTWNFDLSQGAPTNTAMLNAWRITEGTDLVITVDTVDPSGGRYYLSSGASYFGNATFTVKDTNGDVIAENFGNGSSVKVGDFTYKLALEGSGLYLTVSGYPVEVYDGSTLVACGTTVTGEKIVAGMSAFVNAGGTLEDAAVIKAASNKVLVNEGGKITGAEVYGQGTTTDIRVYGGASASNARIGDANGMVRLYGGTAYDTTAVGGQFLMYNGAFASNTTVIDGGVQKLLVSGAAGTVTASNTTVSSGGWIQVGATLQQTQGSYLAGGDIRTVNLLSGGTMYVEVGATAADVTLHAGASAYVYSGGQIAFTSVESDARINVRFSQATGNETALITDWGTVAAGAELSVKEVGGAGTFKIADSVDAGLTVNYDEFDVYGGRDIGIGQNFSDAFRGLNFVLGTDGTLTAADLTIGTQTTAATLDGTNATTLADGNLATTWTAGTDLSTIPVVADADTNADVWLTLDNTTVNGALYGAEGNFANDVNLKFRDGSITNLAAGAKAGGNVANVNVMVGEINPDWTEVSHGTTFNGVAYAGGFGSVTSTAGTVLNAGVFKKDFYAGALANKLDAVTNVGEVSMRIFGGTFSGNIYGASAVKTVAGKNGLRHAVGDVTLTVAGGETTKGTQACIFAGGYATGDATGTVYTVESVTLDISGGSWGTACGGRGVFGGIMASGVTAEAGDVAITITKDNSPTMGNVYGGGWAQKGGTSIVGDVNISIEGGEIANVFGGGTHSASAGSENSMTETGDITITVKGGTITNAIYAKGQGANDSTGSAAVVFKGAGAFECGVYGYSYVGGAASDATLSFSGYTGTFAGAIGGFDSVTFDGVTNMTLTTAAEDVSNSSWNFDVAERSTKFADIAMLNWTAADFTGDTITLNLATGDANEWSLVSAATDTVYNNFDVLVDGSAIAAELHLGDKISGGAYDGWGFTNDEGTLKFKQLA